MTLARTRLPLAPADTAGGAIHESPVPPPVPEEFERSGPAALVDGCGRYITYVRISLTDRCDLRCTYCMPVGGEPEHAERDELMSFEEVARIVSAFAAMGVDRARLTGGEPLVRKDIVGLVQLVRRRTSLRELLMTTNGTRLAELALPLRRAGLDAVNVSLDSLDAVRFCGITGGGVLGEVLAGIDAAVGAGLRVGLNTVVLAGENDHEVGRIVEHAWSVGATPRFIELMPVGRGAEIAGAKRLGLEEILQRLSEHVDVRELSRHPARGPARYATALDGSGRRVGVIAAVSAPFCDSCNRVRVDARGRVLACLASRQSVSLLDRMRAGASDRELRWAVRWGLGAKEATHDFGTLDPRRPQAGMSLVGG